MAILCCSAHVLHAQNSATIMTVNGQPIDKGEFVYTYNKNRNLQAQATEQSISVKDYAQMFANYKVKVEAAKAAGIDTTEAFRSEYALYRGMQLNAALQDTFFVDSVARSVYAQMQRELGGKDMLRVRHLFIATPQHMSTSEAVKAKERIDSLHARLEFGDDFALLAQRHSEDPASAVRGGELPWFGQGQAVKEFEEVAYSLKVGVYSRPFVSPMGYHVIEVLERKALEPYEEKRSEILAYLKQQGIEEVAAQRVIEQRIAASGGKVTREQILAEAEQQMLQVDPELKYLLREYYDGLLLIAISEREVWDAKNYDSKAVAKFFKKRKKAFHWEAPRFKGYVMHLHDKQQATAVKQWMKRHAHGDWTNALDSVFNRDSAMVRVTEGVYRQGDNPYVDHAVYKQAEAQPTKRFPYVFVEGKMLKQPKAWTDDRNAVLDAYRKEIERLWVEKLRMKFSVVINEAVLAEVESH